MNKLFSSSGSLLYKYIENCFDLEALFCIKTLKTNYFFIPIFAFNFVKYYKQVNINSKKGKT